MKGRATTTVSERVYAALMHVYPRTFRAEYGDEMIDYFRDRRRDEHARSGGRGVARLWIRTLIDLASTATHEHITAARLARSS